MAGKAASIILVCSLELSYFPAFLYTLFGPIFFIVRLLHLKTDTCNRFFWFSHLQLMTFQHFSYAERDARTFFYLMSWSGDTQHQQFDYHVIFRL